jgi:predicted DCC family thiol-disulfide oxidoreductase YuxK
MATKLSRPIKIGLSDPRAKLELKKYGVQFINKNTIYYLAREKVFTKSHAIFQIALQETYPFKILSLGRFLPKSFTDRIYDWVAKNRYRLN